MGGRASFDNLATSILRRSERVRDEALDIVTEFATNGKRDMEQIVQDSKTKTGYQREADGKGVAGRIDSEGMINDLGAKAGGNGSDFIGQFGWVDGFEDYYRHQDDGTKTIKAMHALQTANIKNREHALARIQALARG